MQKFRSSEANQVLLIKGRYKLLNGVVNYSFPWLRVAAAQILEWDFELEGQDSNDGSDTHGMDLTGLKWSATVRGTRFRTHRLMPWIGK